MPGGGSGGGDMAFNQLRWKKRIKMLNCSTEINWDMKETKEGKRKEAKKTSEGFYIW